MNFSWVYVQYDDKNSFDSNNKLEASFKFELNPKSFDSGTHIENLLLEKFSSLKLILTPENTIHWYKQGTKNTWTSKIADKLVEQAIKEKKTFKEPENIGGVIELRVSRKTGSFSLNFSAYHKNLLNSGLKSTEQFLNLSENVEHIKRQKKKEDIYSRFCDYIKKLKSNDQFYKITTVNNEAELLDQTIINNCHDAILEMNLEDFDVLFNFNFKFDPPKGVESWIDNIWDNEIEEITRPDLRGVNERFFKNSVEELFKLIDKCKKQNLKEINEATWLQMLYPQIDAAIADLAQLIPQNTSNSLSQLIGSDESQKPDYTVFCITKDNSSLEFAALFLKGAKPVKKDELGNKKCQLDKERLQSIIKLYFDYILVRIQSLYGKFLTRELSKEILAIPLITMQTAARVTIPYYKGVNAEERSIQKTRAKNLVFSMWKVRIILKIIKDYWSKVIKRILESKEALPEQKINLITKKAKYMSFEFGKHIPVK
ncbi:17085_t:CDS:10 [Gigaspora margarita]|uniref:17085_t:CDS:1 n=1 Tax=Gigaspora margarita TaxID=4874 RepID=A0ABM8VZP4_GIGMA|nr:17085_t:CDS:10 [Gigaspora margarita]